MQRIFLLLLAVNTLACTGDGEVVDRLAVGISPVEDSSLQDVHILVPDDAGHSLPPEEYRNNCWITEYWQCPPFDEVWMVEVTLDICDDSGEPCTPQEIADPNCTWELVSETECLFRQECDPSDTSTSTRPCETLDIHGNTIAGRQEVRCSKGTFERGPCEPCEIETCDGSDNDCDIAVDEGLFPCSNECGAGVAICVDGETFGCTAPVPEEEVCDFEDNDCDGEIDEGKKNRCGGCGELPVETCDGLDNDCDGSVDENLVKACETVCEAGIKICLDGEWSSCSAKVPLEEACDLEDNDCDGGVDEGLQCSCPPEMIGAFIPCMEPPLLCGRGLKTCECVGGDCSQTSWTECKAECFYFPQGQGPCDPFLGRITDEICNGHDENCNHLIDEELRRECYSGPIETLDVGVCQRGFQECSRGQWGGFNEEEFFPDVCVGEVTPSEELCNGADDNCDGVVGEELGPTDILLIIDVSGSMISEINAVAQALIAFAANYEESPNIRWGIVAGPYVANMQDYLRIILGMSPLNLLLASLNALQTSEGQFEMLLDALYLSILELTPPALLPNGHQGIEWDRTVGQCVPALPDFRINWRDDTKRVVIIFSDEGAQSYLIPQIGSDDLRLMYGGIEDLSVHIFTPEHLRRGGLNPWSNLTHSGSWHELSRDQEAMFDELMGVIEEEVCGQDE